MRVAIVGAGGMGGFFGGLLARSGADVALIARGEHLRAMQRDGLRIRSELFGEFAVRPEATDDPEAIGEVDLLLFCVKSYDLEEAALQCRPLVGEQTTVIPVQNGIETVARLEEVLGAGKVLGGLTYVAGQIEAPGRVVQQNRKGELIFGEPAGGRSTRTERILAFFEECGVPAELSEDIGLALWEKFTVICGTGGVLALLRQPFGAVFADPDASELMREVMAEVVEIARARDVDLAADTADRLLLFLRENMAPRAKSSQLADLERGRRLELEFLNGAAVRLGRETGIPTPFNFAIYAALKPYAGGAFHSV